MGNDNSHPFTGPVCPVPLQRYPQILLAHGSGGKLTDQLIRELIAPVFSNPALDPLHDGALVDAGGVRLAFSTDSYVINPIFFPGGDIGRLAVFGTVNDLAMCAARPAWLSAGFIVEEGLPMEDLARVVRSMNEAALQAGVAIVTGDTKVVERGKGDKIYINTAGIGLVPGGRKVSPAAVRPGDAVLINGAIGLHGVAVMSFREGLRFSSQVESDCAPLNTLVEDIYSVSPNVRMLRDPTRGGLASALNEIAREAKRGILLDEHAIPVTEEVRAACELLGLDPLYVANEGKCLVFVSPGDADAVLSAMRKNPAGKGSAIIGTVTETHPGRVTMKTLVGGDRIVDMMSGEQLPRIC